MENKPHEGERLLLLVRRSEKLNTEIAQMLEITPNSLSRLFRAEVLSKKVKRKAALVFGVPVEYFSTYMDLGGVREPQAPYLKPDDALARVTRLLPSGRVICILIASYVDRKQTRFGPGCAATARPGAFRLCGQHLQPHPQGPRSAPAGAGIAADHRPSPSPNQIPAGTGIRSDNSRSLGNTSTRFSVNSGKFVG